MKKEILCVNKLLQYLIDIDEIFFNIKLNSDQHFKAKIILDEIQSYIIVEKISEVYFKQTYYLFSVKDINKDKLIYSNVINKPEIIIELVEKLINKMKNHDDSYRFFINEKIKSINNYLCKKYHDLSTGKSITFEFK